MLASKSMKYKLSEKDHTTNLHRVVATKSFADVKVGDVGGWVSGTHNLSQTGNCWIYDNASVFEDAFVSDNARVRGNALVYANAHVYQDAEVRDHAQVCGNSRVYGFASVSENAWVGFYDLGGFTFVKGDSSL